MAKSKPEPERSGFVRTTITIPADLKDEMERLAGGENWSALAAECFRARVTAIKASQPTRGEMGKIVERLKAAAEADRKDGYDMGKAMGRSWAEDQASPAQLQRLAEFDGDRYAWEGRPKAPWNWADKVVFAVNPKIDRDDRHTAKELIDEFWERALGDDAGRVREEDEDGPPDFLRGFVDGAVELWEIVSSKV